MIIYGVFWGYHHLRKPPYLEIWWTSLYFRKICWGWRRIPNDAGLSAFAADVIVWTPASKEEKDQRADGGKRQHFLESTIYKYIYIFYISSICTLHVPFLFLTSACTSTFQHGRIWRRTVDGEEPCFMFRNNGKLQCVDVHGIHPCRRYALHEVAKLPRAAALTHGSARRRGCRWGARHGTGWHGFGYGTWERHRCSFYESLQRSREGQQEI